MEQFKTQTYQHTYMHVGTYNMHIQTYPHVHTETYAQIDLDTHKIPMYPQSCIQIYPSFLKAVPQCCIVI